MEAAIVFCCVGVGLLAFAPFLVTVIFGSAARGELPRFGSSSTWEEKKDRRNP